jgi:RNA polymerase sigma factor (sigma-70 family)
MNPARPAHVLRQLERPASAPGTDAELIARFTATSDSAAFAELVRRHGPLVLGVCRRVAGQQQDAEDAFQATFLVLAKKAGQLRNPELLGNYLYGVAFRVAWRAKRSARRRRVREVLVGTLPDLPALTPAPPALDLTSVLDEELAALSACYREAIVLCDLLGASRSAAAAALGVPEGTLSSRLANGHKKLAARLVRRGIAPSALAVPAALAEARAQASQPVAMELITRTCGLVADWSAGAAVPTPLARLIEGGFPVRKLMMLGVVMALGVAGAVLAAHPRAEAPPVEPPKPLVAAARPEPAPQPKAEPKPKDEPAPFTSAPRLRKTTDVNMTVPLTTRWNATGTHLAVSGREPVVRPPGFVAPMGHNMTRPVVHLIGPTTERHAYPEEGSALAGVGPDGSEVITALREYDLISGHHQLKWWGERGKLAGVRDELIEGRSVDLDLPETHGYAFAPDGKSYRTVADRRDPTGTLAKLDVLEVNALTGKAGKPLISVDFGARALSANGKRLAVVAADGLKVTVYDVDRGTKLFDYKFPEPPADVPKFGPTVHDPVLSPDGRRLIVSRGPGMAYLLNTETGEPLQLEGIKQVFLYPATNAFTGDGRLLASRGTRYALTKLRSKGPPGGMGGEYLSWVADGDILAVWDTRTGKALKTWDTARAGSAAFNPARPQLVVLESNTTGGTRIGFWDFSAEVEKK